MDDFNRYIEILTAGDRNRVWSLVVTVFGDLAQGTGDTLSMQTLARITEPLGVKPEALRVALHRLKKDGWIVSERQGRNSLIGLTDFGRTQSTEAAPLIYRRTGPNIGQWAIFIASPQSQPSRDELERIRESRSSFNVSPNEVIAPAFLAGDELLRAPFDPTTAPEWVLQSVFPKALQHKYAHLNRRLADLSAAIPEMSDPFKIATLRTLLVHNWRRIVLSHPDVDDVFIPGECRLKECRSRIDQLLTAYPCPSLDLFESN